MSSMVRNILLIMIGIASLVMLIVAIFTLVMIVASLIEDFVK